MTWGAVAGAAISVVGGALASRKAANSQKNAMNQQDAAAQAQVQLGHDQLDFSKQQYSDWQKHFDPSISLLGSMAQQEIRPDYSQIAQDVGGAFDTSQGINERNMQRFGIAPTDGAFQTGQTQYGLSRALATVSADQNARTVAQQQQWNRLAGFVGAGMGQQSALLGSQQSAANGLMGAFGNQAAMYGQRANMYGNSAAAGAGLMGAGFNMLGRSLGNMWDSNGTFFST